jgi:hypothetical protein
MAYQFVASRQETQICTLKNYQKSQEMTNEKTQQGIMDKIGLLPSRVGSKNMSIAKQRVILVVQQIFMLTCCD